MHNTYYHTWKLSLHNKSHIFQNLRWLYSQIIQTVSRAPKGIKGFQEIFLDSKVLYFKNLDVVPVQVDFEEEKNVS